MSLIEEDGEKRVNMAYLAIVCSQAVNGVVAIHSQIIIDDTFKNFYEMSCWLGNKAMHVQRWTVLGERIKWQNKTNGITPRRWLLLCNPSLAQAITDKIGDDWHLDLTKLRQLEEFASDKSFIRQIAQIKQENKGEYLFFLLSLRVSLERLATWLSQSQGVKIDSKAMFDIHVKRIHEYKRQLLNALHMVHLYNEIKNNPE